MKNFFIVIIIVVVVLGAIYFFTATDTERLQEGASADDELADLIVLEYPQPGDIVTSPLTIRGKARGPWFFEATFPVMLTNWDGLIIASHYAEAQDEWMTEEFVPFEAVLEFESPAGEQEFTKRGSLILHKANASGLPEHDNAFEISVYFE